MNDYSIFHSTLLKKLVVPLFCSNHMLAVNTCPRFCVSSSQPMNTLMLTHVMSCLPTSRHYALMCSAGSQGYCALKEMLDNGMPGHTLLLESGNLLEVSSDHPGDACCLIYTFNLLSDLYSQHGRRSAEAYAAQGSHTIHSRTYWGVW